MLAARCVPRASLMGCPSANRLARVTMNRRVRCMFVGRRKSMNLPQTALITGASRGLGRALAFELARHDVRVALVARDKDALSETVDALRAEGAVAYGIAADVADKYAIHPIAGQAQASLGPIDLVIHNASSLGPTPLRLLLD